MVGGKSAPPRLAPTAASGCVGVCKFHASPPAAGRPVDDPNEQDGGANEGGLVGGKSAALEELLPLLDSVNEIAHFWQYPFLQLSVMQSLFHPHNALRGFLNRQYPPTQ